MQKITPFLWFDSQAEEAVKFYCTIFAKSKITNVSRYTEAGPGPKGQAMSLNFDLEGQSFIALNGGPQFKFTEAISFVVDCKTQAELDKYWTKLTKGGQPGPCGWLKDKYGLSGQVGPTLLGELPGDKDEAKAGRVMQAMLKMTKIDIQALKDAYKG